MSIRSCFLCTAIVVSAVFFGAAKPGMAQLPDVDYEKVLLPTVFNQPLQGAFGSLWVTELTITNTTDQEVWAFYHSEGGGHLPIEPPPTPSPLPPNTTVKPFTFSDQPGQRGTFFFIDSRFIDRVAISLRVQDLSRQLGTWGTALPVAREFDFVDHLLTLNDVRADPTSRVTLRVYSFDGTHPATVRLTLYGVKAFLGADWVPDALLGTRDFSLSTFAPAGLNDPPHTPGFLEIPRLDLIAPLADYDRVRIDVTPLDPGTRIWAFASITNNETQHVTIIAPSQ
jgi:hypothetical protein